MNHNGFVGEIMQKTDSFERGEEPTGVVAINPVKQNIASQAATHWAVVSAGEQLQGYGCRQRGCSRVITTASGYSEDGPVSSGSNGLSRRFASRNAAM